MPRINSHIACGVTVKLPINCADTVLLYNLLSSLIMILLIVNIFARAAKIVEQLKATYCLISCHCLVMAQPFKPENTSKFYNC